MQRSSFYIVVPGAMLACASMLYFLSLVLHLPFFAAIILVTGGAALFGYYFVRSLKEGMTASDKSTGWMLVILCACLAIFVQKVSSITYKYGGWDAWCIWNLHARYMMSANTWRGIFSNTIGHPDYPLLQPGIIAFFTRLFSRADLVVIPFIFSFAITLSAPVLIYLQCATKNMAVAALTLFLFAQDTFYILNGVSQYADITLGFFFLCVLIASSHARERGRFVFPAAFLLGCCAWTKNEGIILAAVAAVFYGGVYFSRRNIRHFLGGIALPLIVLLVFKAGYAPANDIVGGQGKNTFHQVFDLTRYQLIWKYFADNMDNNFVYLKIAFFGYVLLCIAEKRWPDKNFFLLVTCIAAYLFIYVVTWLGLEWQLGTSLYRLMLQLMPAMMYVIAQRFAEIKILLPEKKL